MLKSDNYVRKAKILRVTDGDTVEAEVDLGFNISYRIKVRVKDLDTPETFRPKSEAERKHGKQATLRAKDLLLDSEVLIKSEKDPSIYGRYTAKIQLEDGKDYSDLMVSEGFSKKGNYDGNN